MLLTLEQNVAEHEVHLGQRAREARGGLARDLRGLCARLPHEGEIARPVLHARVAGFAGGERDEQRPRSLHVTGSLEEPHDVVQGRRVSPLG